MAKQLLGRVAMDFKGEFNSSSTYEKLDVVVYEGCSYCALKETKGTLPTNEEFFVLLVRKPISGIDYFTEDEKKEFVSRITNDANSLFNQNVESKTREFNTNHQDKVNDFNSNYDTKLSSFDSNYDSKVKNFNNNVSNQTTTFNENVVEKQKEFDDNVTNRTETFNTNTTNKINEYDTNASKKLNDYNSNANNKVEEFNANAVEKTNEFNSTANAQKITNLSNEFYRVKDEVLETGEASDTFIHIEDSAMSEMQELEIEGVCQQETTSGSNLIDLNVTQDSRITYNTDGTITINGNGGFMLKYSPVTYIANKTYYMKWQLISGEMSVWHQIMSPNGKTWCPENEFKSFMLDSDTNVSGFWLHQSSVFNNAKIKIWISESATDYEPYTGGQPSPSPDYPQEIKTITGSLKVTSCNKNLFDKNSIYATNMFYEKNDTGWQYIGSDNFNTFGDFKVAPNKTYALSYNSTDYTWGTRVIQFDKYGNLLKGNIFRNNNQTFTTLSNTSFIRFSGNKTVNSNIQIEEKAQATTYEEQLKTQINANLGTEFIGKISDTYKDTLSIRYNQDDGQYHLTLNKMLKKITFDGSVDESWEQISFKTEIFQIKVGDVYVLSDINTNGNIMSNYLKNTNLNYMWNNNVDGITNLNSIHMIRVRFKDNPFTNVEELKSWLSTHNLEVYYTLAEPYEVDLGVVDIPLTYNEVTNVSTDSDLFPKINVKYYRNFKKTVQNLQVNNDTLKNELMNIEDRLTALENVNTSVVDGESEESE